MKALTLMATLDNIPAVTEFIDEQLEALDCPMKARMQLDIAVDELFSNIARYAYGEGVGEATVCFDVEEGPKKAVLTFLDRGVPYNPLTNADPDTSLGAEERAFGGLGVFMVKKSMDEMSYAYENGQNILTIRKRL